MEKQPIFFDPARRRWKRTLRLLNLAAVLGVVLLAGFIFELAHSVSLPALILHPHPNAYPVRTVPHGRHPRFTRVRYRLRYRRYPKLRHRGKNGGIRAAFYVNWDAPSYASLRTHIRDFDFVFAEWLHAITPDGEVESTFDANADWGNRDSAIQNWIRREKSNVKMIPLLNNYDGSVWQGDILAQVLSDPDKRQNLEQQAVNWVVENHYTGLMVDFEGLPRSAQPDYQAFVAELHPMLQADGLKLFLSLPVTDDDYNLGHFARNADTVLLMDYDQHTPDSAPGPIAAQDWFDTNLRSAMRVIPHNKLMLGLANYAYDWPAGERASTISVQQALLDADESGSALSFDPMSLNPELQYSDDTGRNHQVWMTDALTAVNEMRVASSLGINSFAVWRLGSGDNSLWPVFDKANDNTAVRKALSHPPPGNEIDIEGKGDIMQVAGAPETGERTIHIDKSSFLLTDETYLRYPQAYRIEQYGWEPKTVALSFDDGPDPQWTPAILKILKQYNVPATFFEIGVNAERYPSIVRQVYQDGNEIGNHTFLHPDAADITSLQLRLELNGTQRLLENILGVKTVLFRPPYGVDSTPETNDEVVPLQEAEQLGYIVVGNSIDPHDWKHGKTADEIVDGVFNQLGDGSIILMHDGGGNREQTVLALPRILQGLRDRGYRIVQLSDLMGKTRAEVMPKLGRWDLIEVRLAGSLFLVLRWIETAIIWIFFAGIVLMGVRVFVIGLLAILQKLRPHRPHSDYAPPLAVVIPAYNESAVVVNTVHSVLRSRYEDFRVIVVDDGSTDNTFELLRENFALDPRVVLLHKSNGGKASALNLAISQVREDAFITIDADTNIDPDALRLLARHLSDPAVGAIAGNAKVGNRINLVTWFQAGEYITSQNLERRALDVLNCITVVPGAIGCWRSDVVRKVGGFTDVTAAEDADLTVTIRRLGYRIVYEDGACAYTEAPVTVRALMKQRFRWSYGIMQTVWKHRDAFGREGTLGKFALPNIVVFQLVLPLLGPITDFMLVFALLMEWFEYTMHPQSWTPDSLERLLFFFAVLMLIDVLGSVLAFALEHKEQWTLTGSVLLQRVLYRHVMAVVMYRTIKHAIKGGDFHWGKLDRTGTVKPQPVSVP